MYSWKTKMNETNSPELPSVRVVAKVTREAAFFSMSTQN